MNRIEQDMGDGQPRSLPRGGVRRASTRIGFVSLVDAAPLFVALDGGIFARHGLDVTLHKEVGWATIREKVLFGELDAAHALCSMPFSATLGLSSVEMPCIAGLVLSRGGNAIVMSEDLWKRGVRDGDSLRQDISNRRHFRKYIFATVFPCSTHAFLLRDWFRSAGIDPEADVQMVTLPPSQMVRNLAAGTIDGFCAGEPWPSLAISQEIGWSPATSSDIYPGHPEKVLMVREDYHEKRRDEHLSMIAALIEACAICDDASKRSYVARLMANRNRINCEETLLEECLSPQFNYGMGRVGIQEDFLTFHKNESNAPDAIQANWVLQRLAYCSPKLDSVDREKLNRRVFRPDIYKEALKRVGESSVGFNSRLAV